MSSASDSTHGDWWLREAGEYVLGTLWSLQRDLFEKLLEKDADAYAAVRYWEHRLAPLDSLLHQDGVDLEVPVHVWEQIERRLDGEQVSLDDTVPTDRDAAPVLPARSEPFADRAVERQLQRWQQVAGLAIAASIVLATVLVVPLLSEQAEPQSEVASAPVNDGLNIVAVLSGDDSAPLWLVVADETDGSLSTIAMQTPVESVTQSHQLWVILPDDGGVESIGVLPYGDGSVKNFQLSSASALERLRAGAAFAVSLEPVGGTDGSGPTGPVISSSAFTRVDEPF